MTHSNNDIVIDLGFGDAGKGATVDWLVTQQPTNYVVKFSGGPQSAHNVVLPDGTHHTFAQFGSGTLRGIPTLITKDVLVNPFNMAVEADALAEIIGRDPFENTQVAATAPLITPIHQAANHAREIARGGHPHGSCGQGLGEAQLYRLAEPTLAPTIGDMRDLDLLAMKLHRYAEWAQQQLPDIDLPDLDVLLNSYAAFVADDRLRLIDETAFKAALNEGHNVFEGSQGVLLDEWHGFHPHTTWSTTTAANAQRALVAAGLQPGKVTGVTRTYTTRHGAGPFPSEFPADRDWQQTHPEAHNTWGRWQGGWRVGNLDMTLLRYAFAVQPVDEIALTHADIAVHDIIDGYGQQDFLIPRWDEDLKHQERMTNQLLNLRATDLHHVYVTGASEIATRLELAAGAPVTSIAAGPTAVDRKVNR